MSALATISTGRIHHNPKPTPPPHTGGAVIIELPRLGRAPHPATVRGATEQGPGQPTKPFARLLDAKAIAEMLNVPHTWVLAQARANAIPHHRLGHYVRFDPDDIAQWLTEGRTKPRWRH